MHSELPRMQNYNLITVPNNSFANLCWVTSRQIHSAYSDSSSSKDDLSHVQYARNTFPLPAAGCAPHLAYLSSLSLGGRTYSGLGWRIFSPPCFHPSGAPTIGHGKALSWYWILMLVPSATRYVIFRYSVFSI